MLADGTQTIVVTPRTKALITGTHVVLDIAKEGAKDEYVEIFSSCPFS
jgi:5-oxoprolinase (ATP-hydrolysing)